MQLDSLKVITGGFFVLVGLVMVVFHKAVSDFYEDWFGTLSQSLPLMPRGRFITICAIVFGVVSIIGGGLVLLSAFLVD